MSAYETILVETHDRVGLVRLNRPGALNALNNQLLGELMDALAAFDADPAIGAMVITGNEKAFAAGADIKEMASASAVEMLQWDNISQFDRIMRLRKPVIAAVSGYCLGGGNELAMACDMIVASESARFGQPEINLGVIPGAGGTQRLARAVGKAVATAMVLNNRTLTAQEALRLG
ncbi:MAG: enoyl-CoA hydratase-related protein, partial [Anaerolineales bacterium]|nr:enoyl-CoA hydratase-related protein [Anaerolineales bacterium]